jgi:hypothetical protein
MDPIALAVAQRNENYIKEQQLSFALLFCARNEHVTQ